MSERDIKRWQDTITPRDKAPQPWTIGSGGSWDMMEVQPVPDAMLADAETAVKSADSLARQTEKVIKEISRRKDCPK